MWLQKIPMIKLFRDILRLLRPRQWVKNTAIYGALLFSGQLFYAPMFIDVSYGFFIFLRSIKFNLYHKRHTGYREGQTTSIQAIQTTCAQ